MTTIVIEERMLNILSKCKTLMKGCIISPQQAIKHSPFNLNYVPLINIGRPLSKNELTSFHV